MQLRDAETSEIMRLARVIPVLVLEGDARRGPRAGQVGHVRTVHAEGSGDDAIVDEVRRQLAIGDGRGVTVVTADRGLRERVEVSGASSRSPRWLLDQW